MSKHRKDSESLETSEPTLLLPQSLAKTLRQTAKLYNATLDEEVVKIWRDLTNYCLEKEAVAALQRWQYESAYFPKPSEILQSVANERDRRKRQSDRAGCEKCNQGWIVVNPEATRSDWKVKACECLTKPELRTESHSGPMSADDKNYFDAWMREWNLKLGLHPKRFPNGNPRYNHALVQARVLGQLCSNTTHTP